MYLPNSDQIMSTLKDTDRVLDVGGWGHPFNRANAVLDLMPYETRGFYNRTFARNNPIPPIGGTVEHFSEKTWYQRDICSHQAWPFEDHEFDFAICSHTLEDIRDPLWVCHELQRVGKAGYIEVPSRLWETCRGCETGMTGLSHHRWLIDIDQDSKFIRFTMKYHAIHRARNSLPPRVLKSLSAEQAVTWLYWEGSFKYEESVLHGEDQYNDLSNFRDSHLKYPGWRRRLEDSTVKWMGRGQRVFSRLTGARV